jgi:CRP/FNR family transcriptional regulator, cyclic AMP receptor protein
VWFDKRRFRGNLVRVHEDLARSLDLAPRPRGVSAAHSFPRRRAVAILDVDPDLARDMDAERAAAARSHAIAAIETLAPGEWPAEALDIIEPRGALGLLVVDGLISRDVTLGSSSFTELIGEGEILRPWDTGIELATETPAVTWNVLVTARIAILDGRFVARTARWPELTTALVARAIKRSRALAVQLAICNLQRVETRLLLLMWHLAERWGKVSVDGIVLPLGLTHRMLASLVGARRPTVTTALKELTAQGKVTRREDGMWVLHGEPPVELGQMYATLS